MFFASMLQINSTLERLDLGDCDMVSNPVKLSAMTEVFQGYYKGPAVLN